MLLVEDTFSLLAYRHGLRAAYFHVFGINYASVLSWTEYNFSGIVVEVFTYANIKTFLYPLFCSSYEPASKRTIGTWWALLMKMAFMRTAPSQTLS